MTIPSLRLPSIHQLEKLGTDAASVLDAQIHQIELLTIPDAAKADMLDKVEKRRAEFFGFDFESVRMRTAEIKSKLSEIKPMDEKKAPQWPDAIAVGTYWREEAEAFIAAYNAHIETLTANQRRLPARGMYLSKAAAYAKEHGADFAQFDAHPDGVVHTHIGGKAHWVRGWLPETFDKHNNQGIAA